MAYSIIPQAVAVDGTTIQNTNGVISVIPSVIGNQAITIPTGMWDSIVQGSYQKFAASGMFGAMIYNSSSAINDRVEYGKVNFVAGTYTINIEFGRNSAQGQAHVLIDDVDVGSVDGYIAGSDNTILSITGVAITQGLKKLSIKMSSKNASSSEYRFSSKFIQFVKTA